MTKIIFSGIQPTGQAPHLGNFLGAISQWRQSQKNNQCYFCVVDLHAITVLQDPKSLSDSIYATYALLLALGLDPSMSKIFVQSQVPEHTELAWLLNCFTSVGQLSRMTQYKEKSERQKQFISAGLYDYPVLMAADILLYDTTDVPVGEDQIQHIELTRDTAVRFNKLYGNTFTLPKPLVLKDVARIMSLQEPDHKMSKSDSNQNATLFLLDNPDVISRKIKSAVTDSQTKIVFDAKRPGLYNLLSIYRALTKSSNAEIEQHFSNKGYSELKNELAELVIDFLKPIQEKYQEIIADKTELKKMMAAQSRLVRAVAQKKIATVKEKIGLNL